MSVLIALLRGSDMHLGVSYPVHYIFAVCPSLEDAERAGGGRSWYCWFSHASK